MQATRDMHAAAIPMALVLLILLLVLAPAARAGELERSFAAGPGSRLVIALDFGSVEVERHAGDRIHLVATARGVGAGGVRFGAQADGGDVRLHGDAEPWVHWLRSAPGVRVKARVPAGVEVHVDAPAVVDVSGATMPPERGDAPAPLAPIASTFSAAGAAPAP
jgi:hypothetical protein